MREQGVAPTPRPVAAVRSGLAVAAGGRAAPVAPGITASPVVDVVVPVYNEDAIARARHPAAPRVPDRRTFRSRGGSRSSTTPSTDGTWTMRERLAARADGRAGRRTSTARAAAARCACVWTRERRRRRRVHGRRPLDRSRRAAAARRAARVGPHRRRDRLPARAGSHVARDPKRELISRAYNLILRTRARRALLRRAVRVQGGARRRRARLLPAIEDNGWFFDTELLLLAEHNGLRIHEVPVDWVDDADSRVHVVSTALGDLQGTARMACAVRDGPRSRRPRRRPRASRWRTTSAALVLVRAHRSREHGRVAALFLAMHGRARPDRRQHRRHVRRRSSRTRGQTPVTPSIGRDPLLGPIRRALRWGRSRRRARRSVLVGAVTATSAVQARGPRRDLVVAAVVRFVAIGSAPDDARALERSCRGPSCRRCPAAFSSRSARPCSAPPYSWRSRSMRACRPGSANVIAVCCGIAPSYVANRQLGLGSSRPGRLVREVAALLGALARGPRRVDVRRLVRRRRSRRTGRPSARTIALPLANLSRVRSALARAVRRPRPRSCSQTRSARSTSARVVISPPRVRTTPTALEDVPRAPTADLDAGGRASSGCGAGRTPTRRGSGPRCSSLLGVTAGALPLGPRRVGLGELVLLGRGAGRHEELEGVLLRLDRRVELHHRRQDARVAVGDGDLGRASSGSTRGACSFRRRSKASPRSASCSRRSSAGSRPRPA